jgi:ATP-dependent RNA circularization protein (DNA/RNA ligase family)
MSQYHKINTVFKRDQRGHIIYGEWSTPELKYLQNLSWEFTEKIDGTNIRVMWDGANISFGGKTDRAEIQSGLIDTLKAKFDNQEARFADIFKDATEVCLYGEGFGNKIQKVGYLYDPDGNDFALFDVRVGKWWLERQAVEQIADRLGIICVPFLGHGTLNQAISYVKQERMSNFGKAPMEGIVARPDVQLFARTGERIIAKIKHKDFSVAGHAHPGDTGSERPAGE